MNFTKRICSLLLVIAMLIGALASCAHNNAPDTSHEETYLDIVNNNGSWLADGLNVKLGKTEQLVIDYSPSLGTVKYSASNDNVAVSYTGLITALKVGRVEVTATAGDKYETIIINVIDDQPTVIDPTSIELSISKDVLYVGESATLDATVLPAEAENDISFRIKSGDGIISISGDTVTALSVGTATIEAYIDGLSSNEITVTVTEAPTDPYVNVTKEEFYANYTVATSYMDAYYRSKHGFMSGNLTVPTAAPAVSEYQPTQDGMLVRNTETVYLDGGNTYVVVDAYGNEVMKIYRNGGYITLEEVAAYVYAFGTFPANHISKKDKKAPASSPWGEYLRINHSYFSGDTSKYPYEPELPNINGCGGTLQYWEMDVGTTGSGIYNNGNNISRGAARIVYAKSDLNGNGIYEKNEHYLFYTYNHYNDFQEYLNYYGGWGKMFGNITGGGIANNYSPSNPPTHYPEVYWGTLDNGNTAQTGDYVVIVEFLDYCSRKRSFYE